jgi:modification methylase
MRTTHSLRIAAATAAAELPDASIALVVTSPPYPMIEMWDESFEKQNPAIGECLRAGDGVRAFEFMHLELDRVWREMYRVLLPGGILCVNIGDATRTIGEKFSLFPNHARILHACTSLGFSNLPNILWRKPTNAPNKFMGSGMLPPGAYVTLEHEHILILRKGGNRIFATEAEKILRRRSAFFWEERNKWFSDSWDILGHSQSLDLSNSRRRSAAFPLEIPFRLVHMFSVQGDTVLDPFVGTGTTTLGAIAAGRNSVGYDIDQSLIRALLDMQLLDLVQRLNKLTAIRLEDHERFAKTSSPSPEYENKGHSTRVKTAQETNLFIPKILHLAKSSNSAFVCDLEDPPEGC